MAILAMVITGLGKTVFGFPRTSGHALGAWTCGFGAPINGAGKAGASIDAFGATAASKSVACLKGKRASVVREAGALWRFWNSQR